MVACKQFFTLLALLILSLSFVSAFSVSENSIDNIIIPDFNYSATFELDITNASGGSYNVYTLTDVEIFPGKITLDEGDNIRAIEIVAREPIMVHGLYSFSYSLKSDFNDNETYTGKMTVKVLNVSDLFEISSEAIDTSDGEIIFYVENQEDIYLEDINVEFSSLLFDFEDTFDIGPNEKKFFEVDVDDEELAKTKAGAYVVNAKFYTSLGEKTVKGKMYLGEKKGVKTQEDVSGFLVMTNSISKINTGNIDQDVEIFVEKNIISRLFTTFNIEPDSVNRDGFSVRYSWADELGPAEVLSVKATTNYLIPLLIVIFALLVIYGFIRFSDQKVEVRKSLHHMKTKGGEFALKVNISVKAKKDLENVSVVDKVPSIVKLYKKFGTSKPDKIDPVNRRLTWNVGDLATGEARVFSYIVYSKVGVVGKFSLPSALVVYEKDGKIHETESSKVFFLSEQTERDE